MKLKSFYPLRLLFQRGFKLAWQGAILLSLVVAPAGGQRLGQGRQLLVRVRDARGAPVSGRVPVNLRGRVGNIHYTDYTQADGTLTFRNLVADDYTIEVSVPGYLPATETINLPLGFPNVIPELYIYLRKESDVDSSDSPSRPLLNDTKAQKEIKKAREKLGKNDLKGAQKHLERAQKAFPDHPEVHYLLGMLHLRRQALQVAKEHFEKSIQMYPQHLPALRALGRLLYQQDNMPGAVMRLEQALTVTNRSADDHMLLAQALLQHNELEKAAFHARQAAELDPEMQPPMRLVICQVLLAQGRLREAEGVLEAYLREFPNHGAVPQAQSVLQSIRQAQAGGTAGNGNTSVGLGGTLRPVKPADPDPTALAAPTETAADVSWAPPDVDANPPAVLHDVPCQVTDVLSRVSERVQDMAGNLGNVNAEETISHGDINRHGQPGGIETRQFDYEMSLRTAPDGTLIMKEMRNGVFGVEALGGFATNAIAAMAMVFHPYYAQDFEVRCEGQTIWQGQPVWMLYFRQRADRPARIHGFRSRLGSFYISLKGRAWIAANSFEIVRLETGMVQPLPEGHLEREQMVIEYRPVRFEQRKQTFWLPASADIYVEYRGKRWHRRHVLANYVHFAVDTKQEIAEPRVPKPPPDPP
jgi:tetratricopeptide (TPR) repeat protein